MKSSEGPKKAQSSTTISCALKSGASLIASVSPRQQARFLKALGNDAIEALPYLFDFWAMAHQLPPPGDWRTWVIMGGRGAGKTRAGAEWVRSIAEGPTPRSTGLAQRIAIVADTLDQAREISVFGQSGIMALSPEDRRPKWISGRRMLEWPNGAQAHLFSASDPERLRGPQFDAAWADELAKWRYGSETWDMLQFGLRLGAFPRTVVTTTPKNVDVLRKLLARDGTALSTATTFANAANLAPSFIEQVIATYGGQRLGRQELEGEMLEDVEGALWRAQQLAALEVRDVPQLSRIVVAIDPPVTGRAGSDSCGIIVAGVVMQGPPQSWEAYVLEDASVSAASPQTWAKAAIAAMDRHHADRLVAEVNQGGDLVEQVIRQVDPLVPYRAVTATKGKVTRAEPVAALYEQGRVRHLPGLGMLEDQMCQMALQGYLGKGSPDRVDALVWALHDLMILPSTHARVMRIRTIGG